MDNIDFLAYIKPELFIVAIVIYAAGIYLKYSSICKDEHIPLVLGILSYLICLVYFLSATPVTSFPVMFEVIFQSFIQGMLITACAVYANQLVKQLGRRE